MIPEKFKERMKGMLGDDHARFMEALESFDAVRGIRINTLKAAPEELLSRTELRLTSIPYAEDGYILEEDVPIGRLPEHHAGMIYSQDPGAMSAVCAAVIKPGMKVADLCAAPGGKSGQAAARIGDGGFLLSNEYVPKRAKITVGNFERLGIKNAVVTSLDTDELTRLYDGFFDIVIADVPCSGEGMFRKSEEANEEWSEENVKACAERGLHILKNAARLTAPGGTVIYSTCTYSLEENEMAVNSFLSMFPSFSLIPVREEVARATAHGMDIEGAVCDLALTRRFYPHISRGEGQFIALLKRCDDVEIKQTILYKDAAKAPTRDELSAVERFFKENLNEPPSARVARVGDNLILISHGVPIPPRSVFSSGVLLGEVQKGLLFPHHQFFSAYGRLFKRQENLTRGDTRTEKYLHGDEIEAKDVTGGGWCAVLFEGAPLGGGKASAGRIKNHYPKGLRNK